MTKPIILLILVAVLGVPGALPVHAISCTDDTVCERVLGPGSGCSAGVCISGNQADVRSSGTSFREFVEGVIVPIVDRGVIPLLYALAFIFFLVGITQTFMSHNEETRKKGKDFAIWSILALVVMFSVWSLVKLLINVLTRGL